MGLKFGAPPTTLARMSRPLSLTFVVVSACSGGTIDTRGDAAAEPSPYDASGASDTRVSVDVALPVGDRGAVPDADTDTDTAREAPPEVVQLVGAATTVDCMSSPPGEGVAMLTDGDPQTKFLAATSSAWAVFDAGAPYTLESYALTSANDAPERDPVRWVLQGSNDARAFIDLDIQVDRHFAGRFERQAYTVDASVAYRWYRLRMENAGGDLVQVAELELFGTTVFTSPAAAVPAAPTALQAVPRARTAVELEWNDGSDDEVVFRIERADDGSHFSTIGYVPSNVTHFTVTGLEPGAVASYRVMAENAAGISPVPVALVAAPQSALVGVPGPGGVDYAEGGYTLTIVDDAPGATPPPTMTHLIEAFFAAYPATAAEYNPAAPRHVTVQFDPTYDGVAAAGGDHIRISSAYVAGHPNDVDVIVHEGFHLIQAYTADNVPGWATEGLADYVRWAHGTDNNGACWTMQRYQPGEHYTDAYGVTARFFLWLTDRIAPGLLLDLDATLRSGTYSDAFWTERTGESIDQLWADYAADRAVEPVTYE